MVASFGGVGAGEKGKEKGPRREERKEYEDSRAVRAAMEEEDCWML